MFELAQDGTLFLDEIEDLPLELQGKFLRVLQDREFMRLGGTKYIQANARLVAASNKDLSVMVRERLFREDLFYRLNVVPLTIPPLRQRKEDIPLLVEFFVGKYNQKYGTQKTVSQELLQRFREYDWPGNVRELANNLERLVLLTADESLGLEPEPRFQSGFQPGSTDQSIHPGKLPKLKDAVAEMEIQLLTRALKEHKDSRSLGRVLGISHTAVLKKLKKYGLQSGNNSFHLEV